MSVTFTGVMLTLVALYFFLPQSLGGRAEFIGVNGISMTPTMHYGDMAVLESHSSYHVGDIIAYRIPAGEPGAGQKIIHRIVGGNGATGFVTKGDHNSYTDHFWHPTTRDVIGKVWLHVPGAMKGMVFLRSPIPFAILIGVGAFLLLVWPSQRKPAAAASPR